MPAERAPNSATALPESGTSLKAILFHHVAPTGLDKVVDLIMHGSYTKYGQTTI
jgi:hypothetical protein